MLGGSELANAHRVLARCQPQRHVGRDREPRSVRRAGHISPAGHRRPGCALTPKALATSLTLSLPAGIGAELAGYSDDQGYMMLLAPRGWSCSAGYGADGSGGVAVFSAGERVPAKVPADSPVEEVTGGETSACSGCTLGQACVLFATAGNEFTKYFGRSCPTSRLAAETVVHLTAGLVAFADPPGSAATENPKSPDGSWTETCTMLVSDKGVCTAILDYFVHAYQNR